MKAKYLDRYTFFAEGDCTETYSVGRKIRVIYSDTLKPIYHIEGSLFQEDRNLTYVKLGGNSEPLSPEMSDIEVAVVSNRSLPKHEDYPYRENYFWNVLQNSPYRSCVFDTFTEKDDVMIEKKKTNPRYDEYVKMYVFEEKGQTLEVKLIEANEYKLGVSLAVICDNDSDFNFYYDCGQGRIKIETGEYYPQIYKNLSLIIEPKSEDILPVTLSAIGVLYGIYKAQSYQSVTEPDGELQIDRSELDAVNLTAGSIINTPEYKVGSGQLVVYLDGVLLTPSLDYEEVGEERAESSTIRILKDLPDGKISIIIYKGKNLYNTDSPLYYFPRWFENLASNFYQLADRVTKLEIEHLKESGTGTGTMPISGVYISDGVTAAPVVVVEPDAVAPNGASVVLKKELFNDKRRNK